MSDAEENTSGDSENNNELARKKGGHSTMWNFFRFIHDGIAQEVIICQ